MQFEILGDRYQLQDPIGRGWMSTVYRALDLHMGRVVAIKVLRDIHSSDPKLVARFQREAKMMSLLQHPNIIQIYDYSQTDGVWYTLPENSAKGESRRWEQGFVHGGRKSKDPYWLLGLL